MNQVGEWIKFVRTKRRGWSIETLVEELAKANFRYSRTSISSMERGKQAISSLDIVALEQALGEKCGVFADPIADTTVEVPLTPLQFGTRYPNWSKRGKDIQVILDDMRLGVLHNNKLHLTDSAQTAVNELCSWLRKLEKQAQELVS